MTDRAPSLRDRLNALPGLVELARCDGGTVTGVPSGALPLLAWWLREVAGRSVLALTTDPEPVYTDARVWGGDRGLLLFPAGDTPSFDRVPPSEEVTRRRLGTLTALAVPGPSLVVASPAGLVRPTLPVDHVRAGVLTLTSGDSVNRDHLLSRLVALGYRRVPAVSAAGDFAVRGGILDCFGLDSRRPWRAEFVGDQIEELRAFEVAGQTSISLLDSVAVWPARELDLRPDSVERAIAAVDALDIDSCREDVRESWVRDRGRLADGVYDDGLDVFFPYLQREPATTLLDHLGGDSIVLFLGGRDRILRAVSRHLEDVEKLRLQEEERSELPVGARTGLLQLPELEAALARLTSYDVVREAPEVPGGGGPRIDLGWRGVDVFPARFDSFAVRVRELTAFQDRTVLVLCRQQHRIEELAAEREMASVDIADFSAAAPLPAGALVVGSPDVSQGFAIDGAGLEVYTDHEIFGTTKKRGSLLARGARRAESTSARGARRAARGNAGNDAFVIQFAPGDLVVHRDHGIGRFIEMRTVTVAGEGPGAPDVEQEYMTLEYADGERLHVPVAHLDRVDRYIGGADSRPSLARLGTGEWERTKRRAKERTEEVARELLVLYSRRETAEGHAYGVDATWQREMEESFPFEETPDQELVLEEIKRDMEASRPMDRVVCGDVGFGKTELAVRVAFKAAVEGRQVAVLVPTTVLAQQHFLTFSERLQAFPVTVRQLSRFCTAREVEETMLGLQTGGVDIVIGTHRLLQKDVAFRNLGLVIIDEEQRFGVLQKERFKELRVAVDVLSLSATPIPRTLHMSLAGIRDLSVIQTPPEERQPIKTYVTAREEGLIREVITRELSRGGQVFYVHNRVQNIEYEADQLRRLLPDSRIAIAHGQMHENVLGGVMRSFTDGQIDVLVSTTIIESGLDIPNANTIIVNNSHRFGLAQLYQLRGRVGRSGQRAYAYLLYPPEKALTEKADKRLEVIGDLQDLGAGFTLAMRDLEIRGAGNLLGEEQSGDIAAVGLELYTHLLNQAVTSLRGKPVVESPAQVAVSLPLTAFLPAAFISDEKLRLRSYRDLAACVTEAELEKGAAGLADRFGRLPDEAVALIFSLRVRLLAAACGALAVENDRDRVTIQLAPDHGLDLESVAQQFPAWLTTSATRMYLVNPLGTGRTRAVAGGQPEWQDVLMRTLRELGRLARARRRVLELAGAR